MSIKRKKPGAVPVYKERWQELAKSADRIDDARYEYRKLNPQLSLIQAHRVVAEFHRTFVRTFGRA